MADDTGETQDLGTVVVLTPDPNDPAAHGIEDAHITLAYIGQGATDDHLDGVREMLAQVAGAYEPFQMQVSGAGYLGPDRARVLLLESDQLKQMRDAIMGTEALQAAASAGGGKEYPFYIPHMTLGYNGTDLPEELPDAVSGVGLGLWVQGEKESWDLTGGGMAPSLDVVVPISGPDDLELGIRVAGAHPSGRWYVTKRARALGLEHQLPAAWGAA